MEFIIAAQIFNVFVSFITTESDESPYHYLFRSGAIFSGEVNPSLSLPLNDIYDDFKESKECGITLERFAQNWRVSLEDDGNFYSLRKFC